MTEPAQPCIRGCVQPCDCDACRECNQPIHPPQHRPRNTGLLCERCAKNLRGWLHDIPDLYATLDPYESPQTDDTEHHGHHKISGSPALVRLDVVALMDRRTVPVTITDQDGTVVGVDTSLMDVVGVMCSWAAMFAEEEGLTSKTGTLTEATGLLTTWFDTLASQPWIDEMYAELRDVMRALRRAHGITLPKPIGRCINVYERGGKVIGCQAMLYANPSGAIRCTSCGRRYDGRGLILVEMQRRTEQA